MQACSCCALHSTPIVGCCGAFPAGLLQPLYRVQGFSRCDKGVQATKIYSYTSEYINLKFIHKVHAVVFFTKEYRNGKEPIKPLSPWRRDLLANQLWQIIVSHLLSTYLPLPPPPPQCSLWDCCPYYVALGIKFMCNQLLLERTFTWALMWPTIWARVKAGTTVSLLHLPTFLLTEAKVEWK